MNYTCFEIHHQFMDAIKRMGIYDKSLPINVLDSAQICIRFTLFENEDISSNVDNAFSRASTIFANMRNSPNVLRIDIFPGAEQSVTLQALKKIGLTAPDEIVKETVNYKGKSCLAKHLYWDLLKNNQPTDNLLYEIINGDFDGYNVLEHNVYFVNTVRPAIFHLNDNKSADVAVKYKYELLTLYIRSNRWILEHKDSSNEVPLHMTLTPETYYEKHIKGKNAKQIMTEIRRLKKVLGHLKINLERPGCYSDLYNPNDYTSIELTRTYIDIAKEALTAAGGKYVLSKKDLRTKAFEDNVPYICKVMFTIGNKPNEFKTSAYRLYDDVFCMESVHSLFGKSKDGHKRSIPKEEFIERIKALHMGEWLSRYTLERFGIYGVFVGTAWTLMINFSNGHAPVFFRGEKDYPYNFHKFIEIFE